MLLLSVADEIISIRVSLSQVRGLNTLFFLFPYFFRFNFVVSERSAHIVFGRHIWEELYLLCWTFLSGTFFPGGGRGGGVHVHLPYMLFRDVVIASPS